MEFFSTFGGSTVSCAVGLAVLDVVRDERLQAHAREVGDHLLGRLRSLSDRSALVGDVRGSGLFVGVELVRDRETLEPAAAEASDVVNRLREEGILIGTDGPYHNVLNDRSRKQLDAIVLVEDRSLRHLVALVNGEQSPWRLNRHGNLILRRGAQIGVQRFDQVLLV
jgi:adenosylmethionine-8-amino-7-oxononanoate aminotransferase